MNATNIRFKFEDLRVYQDAVSFSNEVFDRSKLWPAIYRFSLIDQLQRAALSISLNIAEGSSRTKRDFAHFLAIARGSCYECIPILTIMKIQGLVKENEYELLYDKVNHLARMITALKEKIVL